MGRQTAPIRTISGERFWPVPLVARLAQVSKATAWALAAHEKKPLGWDVRSFQMISSKEYYVADESVRRLAKRFIHHSTRQPVEERVLLGWRKTGDGQVRMGTAARSLGISLNTLSDWVEGNRENPRKAKFDIDRIPVIVDPLSGYRYISQKFLTQVAANDPQR